MTLSAERLRRADCPWVPELFDEIDSTNAELKRRPGVPEGTVLVTACQTAGRGRLGRAFRSPPGGVYLSAVLRPDAPPERLLHLTPMVAVAMRRAFLDACGVDCGIKWINDLVFQGKKLCGILVELYDGAMIVGIGVNCNTPPEAFPPDVRAMATTLAEAAGAPVDPNAVAAAMTRRLWLLSQELFSQKAAYLAEYAAHCVTLHKPVQLVRGEQREAAFAEGIDENGALLVRRADGAVSAVQAGEVSVRGLYGYTT